MEFSNHSKGITSVKVHHPTGGGSSIQLGGGYGDDDDKQKKTTQDAEVKEATEENKEEEEKKEEEKPAAGQVQKHHEGTRENPAIKARAPPGGASSISFGWKWQKLWTCMLLIMYLSISFFILSDIGYLC